MDQTRTILDLGMMPAANGLATSSNDDQPEFPLELELCNCGNLQLGYCVDPEILYRDYAYFTPQSPSLSAHYGELLAWLQARSYVDETSAVVEIGSNVGRFLETLKPHVRSVLGVDPAANIARVASDAGVPTIAEFFGLNVARELRESRGPADLIVARHCMAHNVSPYAMLDGAYQLLADGGTLVIENAYALQMLEQNEWDQVYHEHMFHFTLLAIKRMLENRGFAIRGVMHAKIHGGSIVVAAQRFGTGEDLDLRADFARERDALDGWTIRRFAKSAARTQEDLREVVAAFRKQGKTVYAYGATAKGATLLNASGLTHRSIPVCVDNTPSKQGRFVPRCGAEIRSEEWAFAHPPDAFLLTAWNYKDELIAKVRAAGLHDAKFIVPIRSVSVE